MNWVVSEDLAVRDDGIMAGIEMFCFTRCARISFPIALKESEFTNLFNLLSIVSSYHSDVKEVLCKYDGSLEELQQIVDLVK